MANRLDPRGVPYPVLFAGIFTIAFATLLFELSMIRVFSFTIWHHFGYVVISTALLGFGASGSFLAVRPAFGHENLRAALTACAALSALGVVGVLGFVSLVPLHPMSILSDAGQAIRLVAYLVVTTVPFFFSGLLVSMLLRANAERVDRVYFWDLIGAGVGCGLAVSIMNWLTPPGAAIVSATAFAVAALIFASDSRQRVVAGIFVVILAVGSGFGAKIPLTPARTKELAMQAAGGYVPYYTRWTALFRTDVTYRKHKPARKITWLWGLSRTVDPNDMELPSYFISHDATAGTGIFDLTKSSRLEHLDYHVLQLPYMVAVPEPRVLVIGVGGGRDIITAVQYGASHVTGAELDPVTVNIVRNELEATNGFFRQPKVDLRATEGRHFVRSTDREFDLVQITGVDTLAATNSGAYVLAENYLYTKEAIHDYMNHLSPDGMLSFAMANVNSQEPLSAGRMVVIAREVLQERGMTRPENHIVVIDSRALYAEVMIRMRPWQPQETRSLAAKAKELKFSILHMPGYLGNPVFKNLATLSGDTRDEFLAGLRYVITPTSDDRPFFQRYFRWSDLLRLGGGRMLANDASALGQIVLALLLMTLTILGGVFILVPLVIFQRGGIGEGGSARAGVLLYFLSIGLGFMLFEISLIQSFVLFLGHPTYSLSVTLGSLLLSLGCGSYLSKGMVGRERTVLPLAIAGMGLLTGFYMTGLPIVQGWFLGSPLLVRCLITVLVLTPLGLLMGIFFPLGIRRAAAIHENLVPWAWGINGCASVTGGVLTVVLAMSFGFTTVWLCSLAIYVAGTAAFLLTLPTHTETA